MSEEEEDPAVHSQLQELLRRHEQFKSELESGRFRGRAVRDVRFPAAQSEGEARALAAEAGVIQDREMLLADARSGRYMYFGPEEDERWETFLTAELPLMPTETLAEFLKQLMVMQDHRNYYQMAVDIEEFDELLVSLQINKGEIAAVFTTDGTTPGYHLVRWVGEPDTPRPSGIRRRLKVRRRSSR
jgi:hypothetical protein